MFNSKHQVIVFILEKSLLIVQTHLFPGMDSIQHQHLFPSTYVPPGLVAHIVTLVSVIEM